MHYAVARRKAIRAVALVLLLTACVSCRNSTADRASAGNTLGTEPPAPTTTTTTNPYAVPAVIDIAYVNRVLAGLDAATGDIVRLVVRTRTIPPEALDRMRAIYSDPNRLQRSIDGFQRDIRDGFKAYQQNPGNKTTLVTELVTATRSCIFARVRRDYSHVGINPPPAVDPQWVALRPIDRPDLMAYNPTHWSYVYDGFEEDRSRPANPCVS
jgi:hypothetical protein